MRAGNSGNEQAGATVGLEHRIRADNRSEPAGDFTHRRQKRQRAGGQLHGLIGDAGDAVREKFVGEASFRGEVQVGEKKEVVTEVAILALHRLLHLEEEVGRSPGGCCIRADCRARFDVRVVRDGRPETGTALYEHLMAIGNEVVHACWRYRHPELVVLDLGRNGDSHDTPGNYRCNDATALWQARPRIRRGAPDQRSGV